MMPKLVPAEKDSDKMRKEKEKENQKNETPQERVKRIQTTEVSVYDFFNQCLDYEMLKLFFAFFFAFFVLVGVATMFYLIFIFLFKEKMWRFYFGSHESHEEL